MKDFIDSSIVIGIARKFVIRINNYLKMSDSMIKDIVKNSAVYGIYLRLCKLSLKSAAAENSLTFNAIYKVLFFSKRKLANVVKTSTKYFEDSIIGKVACCLRQNFLSSFYVFVGTTFFTMSCFYMIMITARVIARQHGLNARLYVVPLIAGFSGFALSYWHKRFEAALQNSYIYNVVRKFICELIK